MNCTEYTVIFYYKYTSRIRKVFTMFNLKGCILLNEVICISFNQEAHFIFFDCENFVIYIHKMLSFRL